MVFPFQESDVIGEGVWRTVPKLGTNPASLFLKSGTLDTRLLSTRKFQNLKKSEPRAQSWHNEPEQGNQATARSSRKDPATAVSAPEHRLPHSPRLPLLFPGFLGGSRVPSHCGTTLGPEQSSTCWDAHQKAAQLALWIGDRCL